MISLIRIDERLVHGQVAVVWTKHLGVNRIVVANDEAADNETQKYAMQMAVPEGVKLSVAKMDRAIALLNDPRAYKLKILVVVKSLTDALTLLKKIHTRVEVNIGNYGRMQDNVKESRKMLEKNLYVDDSDLEIIKELNELTKVFYQAVPNEKSLPLQKLLEKG